MSITKNIFIFLFLFKAAVSFAQNYTVQDSISGLQEDSGFNSITDGQPGTPKKPSLATTFAAQQGSGFQYQSTISLTPSKKGFFRNSLFSAVVPTIDGGEGVIDFQKSVTVSWLQRWWYERNGIPTISTLIATQIPYDDPNSKTTAVFNTIIAKNLSSKSVAYLNAWIQTVDGTKIKGAEKAVLLGYKQIVSKKVDLLFDFFYQSDKISTFEISSELDLFKNLTVGPGLNLTLAEGNDTATWGGGLLIVYQFN